MNDLKQGSWGTDGFFWPSYPVLQRLKDRRKRTTWWFRLKLRLHLVDERRAK